MKVQCLCENKFDVTPVKKIDLDSEPSFVEKIKDGSFNGFKCPKCGTMVRPEVVIHIDWKSKGVKLAYVPEKMRYLCLSFCMNKKAAEKSGEKCPFDEGYTPIIGNWELLDRINSINAGLETVPFEALKFLVLQGAKGNKAKIDIALKSVDDINFQFYVSGVSEDMGVINLPRKLYEDLLTDFQKRKKNDIFKAVVLNKYISYKNIETE